MERKKMEVLNKNIKISAKPQRYKAFTLAEVLITLTIIGVVAAMTIPTLMNNTNEAEYTAQFKKKYTELSQVFNSIRADYGGTLRGVFTGSTGATTATMDPFITKYFNISAKSMTTNAAGNTTWHDPSKWFRLNRTPQTSTCGGCAGYVFTDGSMMYFDSWDVTNCNTWGVSNLCMNVFVDVNGMKKPNTIGKDIYVLYVYENKTVPPDVALAIAGITDAELINCDTSHLGYGCAAERLLK